MTKSQNTKNEQQKDLCITSEQLTEQWKKGELPEGWYYIKCDDGICFDRFTYYGGFSKIFNYSVKQILAPVPSYDELQSMNEAVNQAMAANIKLLDDNKRLKHDVGNLGYKIKNQRHEIDNRLKEIEKLKELLKECRTPLSVYNEMFGNKESLLQQIDEALK